MAALSDVSMVRPAVCAAQMPEARACFLVDPWWPAIPKDIRAALAQQTRCAALVLGSSVFNKPRDDGQALVCEGTTAGLQDAVLGAFGAQPGSEGALLVVPDESHHTMVDDIGAVFKDKCASRSGCWRAPTAADVFAMVRAYAPNGNAAYARSAPWGRVQVSMAF